MVVAIEVHVIHSWKVSDYGCLHGCLLLGVSRYLHPGHVAKELPVDLQTVVRMVQPLSIGSMVRSDKEHTCAAACTGRKSV